MQGRWQRNVRRTNLIPLRDPTRPHLSIATPRPTSARMEFAPEIFAFLIAVAFVAGTVDAMAGGGGLLTIPALMAAGVPPVAALATRSEEHTSELQSLMRISYAVFCLKKKKEKIIQTLTLS